MAFLETLHARNEALFYFGWANFALAACFILLSYIAPVSIAGTNGWHKPVKFALSTAFYAWTMGWFTGYLNPGRDLPLFNVLVILLLGFEVLYIGWQAGRGMMSHYNQDTPLYAALFTAMATAATIVSLATAYIAFRFFTEAFPSLSLHYLWAIRLGLILFVIFSLEGFVMGAQMAHTIGGPDGGPGLPFLNWSRQFGDPRVAHFFGMHALQVLPLLSFYLLKDLKLTIGLAIAYALLAVFVLLQALQGLPFLKSLS